MTSTPSWWLASPTCDRVDCSVPRRLCELALSEPVRSGRADLKLLVAASGPAALADFAGVLRAIPGASLAPGFDLFF